MSNTTESNSPQGKKGTHHYHHQPLDAKTDTAISMFSGALAGVISRTATAPFDRVKTLMQMGRGVPLRPPGITKSEYLKRYGMFRSKSGVAAAARSIYAEGGWRGFFRGNGTNVVKVIPDEALKYSVKRRITEYITGDPDHATLIQHIVAGALSGAVSQTLIYPLEITKTRMTVAGSNEYKGILDCIMNTLKVEGVNGFYKGFVPNILGIIPFQGVYFGLFFFLTDRFEEANGRRPDKKTQFAYSTLASSMSILVSYPLNLVRTKLQTQGVNGRPILYVGMKDCFTKTVEHEGYRGLYRGLVPNYFKALPTLTMSLMLIKATSDFLRAMATGPPPFIE